MKKKLVKLNLAEGGRFSEVDPIRVRRKALLVKSYLESEFDRKADQHEVYEKVMPLVLAALDGTLKMPYPFSDWPLKYESREGLLPRDFERVIAGFEVAASGSHLEEPKVEIVAGEEYAYIDFEEEGDFPDQVKFT
jgi:hypothetical protein